ncbi:MAG: NAD-dependent epimerase/dehydratase family protein, partial [Gemmataceae bacterium]
MKALVTGGGGFLGGAIVRQLLARGDTVRSVSRGYYPDLPCEQVQGDLAEPGVAERAMAGCDLVFHVAAKAGVAGRERDYVRANVEATQRVIDACHTTGVRRLVYTSSPSVVFTGRDLEGVDESVPYPDHYLAAYPRTKAEAERRVLAANSETLATVAL